MVLIDKDRFISYQNPAALKEFESEARLGKKGSHLLLISDRSSQELSQKLDLLYKRGHGATAVVDLRTRPSDPPTWLHLVLLDPQAVIGSFGGLTQVLATIFDPTTVNALDPYALENLFDFTPAEARVAAQLAQSLTADEISIARGISIRTVRVQISEVLRKVGVARTTDAVRLLNQAAPLWSLAGKRSWL